MGLGSSGLGPIGSLIGLDNPSGPTVPGAGRTAQTYQALLQSYLNSQPQIYNAQQTYQPQYEGLDISGLQNNLPTIEQLLSGANFVGAAGNTNTVNSLGASAGTGLSQAYDALNPNTLSLLGGLTSTTGQQLAQGSQMSPDQITQIGNNVQGSWASRGLGTSLPAEFSTALTEGLAGQQQENQAISNASGVAGLNQSVNSSLVSPLVSTILNQSQAPTLTTGLVTGAGPSIVSPAQSSDFLSTGFNAQAASSIDAANNQAAIMAGSSNFD